MIHSFLFLLALGAPEQRAIEFLSREVPAWPAENQCFSCHNNGDAARALFAATRAGHSVPPGVDPRHARVARPRPMERFSPHRSRGECWRPRIRSSLPASSIVAPGYRMAEIREGAANACIPPPRIRLRHPYDKLANLGHDPGPSGLFPPLAVVPVPSIYSSARAELD